MATLKSLAAENGIRKFGTSIMQSPALQQPADIAIIAEHYSRVIHSIPPNLRWTSPDVWNFAADDGYIAYNYGAPMVIGGMHLGWSQLNFLPSWLTDGNEVVLTAYLGHAPTPQDYKDLLKSWVQTVAGHYAGVVDAWTCANEAYDEGIYQEDFWYVKCGNYDYVADIFTWVHEVAPSATLIWNAAQNANVNVWPKTTVINRMKAKLASMLADGVPVHGVGLQCHFAQPLQGWWNYPPSVADFRGVLEGFQQIFTDAGSTDRNVFITEFDLGCLTQTQYTLAQKEPLSAQGWGLLMKAACDSGVVREWWNFGTTDRYCWNTGDAQSHIDDSRTPWDYGYGDPVVHTAKPAYYALIRAMENALGRRNQVTRTSVSRASVQRTHVYRTPFVG